MKNGTCVFFNRKRGWGFATPDDGTNDVFVHVSELPAEHRYLNEGDRISFEIGERNGRPLALSIRLLETGTPEMKGAADGNK